MLPILGLSLLFGCAQSDGKSESRPFTKPDFSEKVGDPQIIIVEVPVQGNSTTFKEAFPIVRQGLLLSQTSCLQTHQLAIYNRTRVR